LYRGGFLIVSILSAVAIAGVTWPGSRFGAVMGNPLLLWIGLRSYAIYLWHWPIFVVTQPGVDVPWGTYPTLVLRLVLTFVAADLSYRFVEVPVRDGALGRLHQRMRAIRWNDRSRRSAAVIALAFGLFVVAVATSYAHAKSTVDQVEQSVLSGGPTLAAANTATTVGHSGTTTAATTVSTIAGAATTAPAALAPGTVTVLTDSVLLGAKNAITQEFTDAGWQVDFRGKAAEMIKAATTQVESAGPVGSLVIVGLGYNSLWEKDRKNYDKWAAKFDNEVEAMLTALEARGAKKIVWVTLREPSLANVPSQGVSQYDKYAWYFPYANEQLRKLAAENPEMVLADWEAISNVPGVTYDAIHLNTAGVRMMIGLLHQVTGV
jgi:hypothetical protein